MRAGLWPSPRPRAPLAASTRPASPPPGSGPDSGSEDGALLGRISRLSGHLVVALVILVVIGGATRVMQAGLACPDWPLCYGALLPGRQMNLQVFLEWFHRLDAFVVGMALLVMAAASVLGRRRLPHWLPWIACGALALVAVQGGLGALTVTRLLASSLVTAHLAAALTLLALISAVHQILRRQAGRHPSPHTIRQGDLPGSPAGKLELVPIGQRFWRRLWRLALLLALALVMAQCLLGGWMASHWAAEQCLASGQGCNLLALHRRLASGAGASLLLLAPLGIVLPGQSRSGRALAVAAGALVVLQIALGVVTLRLGLTVPAVTIAHQLGAALLVALLAGQFGLSLAPSAPSLPAPGPAAVLPIRS
ncbi:cytochrome oxidase assembly protein [Cyanobium sp. PCC 7001]|uniref:COX15/CtaA family protein n=1 Tax=Cyanobium sp. PCC 7001 TaxID=180281 RepID=UPI0001805800|nr:COX15/CtaA family protein [Cyanobium sp. PCC 7001]EDY37748.1 cytochrome oxidase assembly protein [Cyanobium sp. PCC 7001]